MGSHTKKIFISLLMISFLINPVKAQDYSYDDPALKFSDRLKEGMEFTWQFKKYSVDFNESNINFDQITSTVYATTSVYPSETTAYSDEYTTPVETTTVTEEVYIEVPEFPEVPVGALYTIKLLKDLANLTEEVFYNNYEDDYDDSTSYYNEEYFDISVSNGDYNKIVPFFGVSGFIMPTVLEYENGTRLNSIEEQYKEELKWQEEYSETYSDEYDYDLEYPEISLVDGVYSMKLAYSVEDNTINTIQRTHVNTGVLLYVYVFADTPEVKYEIEVELYDPKDLDNLEPNETLALPISAVFVYTLILIPIIINKIKPKNV